MEKADPRILHDAPMSVAEGALVTVTFTMTDFDGVRRTDSDGELLLEIGGTEVPLMIAEGAATLMLELYDSASVKQLPPYFHAARLEPFTIEVTA